MAGLGRSDGHPFTPSSRGRVPWASRRRLAAVAAAAITLGAMQAPATAAGSLAATAPSSCRTGGLGGPFVRVCSTNVFSSGGAAGIGAHAFVTLPCAVSDLVKRTYVIPGKPKAGTVDEGYVYFALYSPDDEIEVGFMHNANLRTSAWSLYVRHGTFWNVDKSLAVPCGRTASLQVLLAYRSGSIGLQVSGYDQQDPDAAWLYDFEQRPSESAWVPNAIAIDGNSGTTEGKSGAGSIAPITAPGWANGCKGCAIAMITAVAQNAPGNPPVNPLQDGASLGPVSWSDVQLLVDDSPLIWGPAQTQSTLVWEKGITDASVSGPPPNYTVGGVSVHCIPSGSGEDRWGCGKSSLHAS